MFHHNVHMDHRTEDAKVQAAASVAASAIHALEMLQLRFDHAYERYEHASLLC